VLVDGARIDTLTPEFWFGATGWTVMSLTGFDPKEIDSFLSLALDTDEDDVPACSPQPVSRAGDLWVMGPHRLLCGDVTGSIDVLMQSEKAHMVFTDPPYNINYHGPGSVGESWAHGGKGTRVKRQVRSMLNDHLSDEQQRQQSISSRCGIVSKYLDKSASTTSV
jgi:hypothetical protein